MLFLCMMRTECCLPVFCHLWHSPWSQNSVAVTAVIKNDEIRKCLLVLSLQMYWKNDCTSEWLCNEAWLRGKRRQKKKAENRQHPAILLLWMKNKDFPQPEKFREVCGVYIHTRLHYFWGRERKKKKSTQNSALLSIHFKRRFHQHVHSKQECISEANLSIILTHCILVCSMNSLRETI